MILVATVPSIRSLLELEARMSCTVVNLSLAFPTRG